MPDCSLLFSSVKVWLFACGREPSISEAVEPTVSHDCPNTVQMCNLRPKPHSSDRYGARDAPGTPIFVLKCGEDMVVALNVDYENVAHWVEAVENAEFADRDGEAPIINLEANFLIPEAERHVDGSFSRMHQLREMVEAAEEKGPLPTVSFADVLQGKYDSRPHRRPDFADEWRLLKRLGRCIVAGITTLRERESPLQATDFTKMIHSAVYQIGSGVFLCSWVGQSSMRCSGPHLRLCVRSWECPASWRLFPGTLERRSFALIAISN
jgi:hypothetical protein